MASRPFRHRSQFPNNYDILQQCPTTGVEVCKTSFREHQVRNFLDLNPTATEFKVIQKAISGRNYFVLQARIGGNDQEIFLFGDLPCPDKCIPPEKELLNPIFDRGHIVQVINTTHCFWIQLHRSSTIEIIEASEEEDDNLFANITIYALTNDGQGGLMNQWDTEDIMFVAE